MAGALSVGGGPGVADDDDTKAAVGSGSSAAEATGGTQGTVIQPDGGGEIIGDTTFWKSGSQYWYWLPDESAPRLAASKGHWDHARALAAGGVRYDASGSKDISRYAVSVTIASAGTQMAIVGAATAARFIAAGAARLRNAILGGAGAATAAANGLATKANEAVFWSGIRGGDKAAASWVATNGGATLETTLAARGITLPVWNASSPAVVAAWRSASAQFAAGARGVVRVLQDTGVRVNSVWAEVEFPALMANPNVTSIVSINVQTGARVVLWP
jgi:hypothetical protein